MATSKWKYQPDEDPKRKHAWDNLHPGFIKGPRGERIGKCPKGITVEFAEQLLNSGEEWFPARNSSRWPQRIYLVHEGWVYRATPTNPGVSYHAFPEAPDEFRKLPRALRERLETRAKDSGHEEEFRKWLKS